jgi:hypothetical protein
MGPLDFPEVLIAAMLIGMVLWGAYNWTHPAARAPRMK